MIRALALATTIALAFALPAVAAPMRCDIAAKYACDPSGCRSNAISVWNVIDLDASRFSRCDHNGCDQYAMVVSSSGAFVNIALPARGALAKLNLDGTEYVEVVTLGTEVLVSFGSCR